MSNIFQEVLKPFQSAVPSLAASCPFLSGSMGQVGTFHGPCTALWRWAPVAGTAGCCQTHGDWSLHSCLSDLRNGCSCKDCCREQLVYTEEGRGALCLKEDGLSWDQGRSWWLQLTDSLSHGLETEKQDIQMWGQYPTICMCVGDKKSCGIPYSQQKIALFLWWEYRDPALWDTLTVKVTWKSQHQWPFPARPSTGCATVVLAWSQLDHGTALQPAPCMAGHFHPTASPQVCHQMQ